MMMAASPIKIPIKTEELIEMTEPAESFTLSETQQKSAASFFAGVGSGTLSSIACAPLDLVRTRMQVMGDLDKAKNGTASKGDLSIVKSLRDILQKDGVKGCFRGLGPTLFTVPTFWGLYFPLYETIKRDLHSRYNGKNDQEAPSGPVVHMTSAILAGGVADFFCNPMFVVRTRMQTEALHYLDVPVQERRPHGVISTVRGLYAEGGVRTFWKGFVASLLGLTHVGIQFPVYEYLKAEARKRSEDNEESALDLFLASATSKMIATTLTYPHEVVRSRLMDSRGVDKNGVVKTLQRIVRNEGYGALYTGIHVSLVRVLPNCCITFMSYEMILRWATKNFE